MFRGARTNIRLREKELKEITKDERDYLRLKAPNIAVTIIGRSKGEKQKRYYAPDCESVNYWLGRFKGKKHDKL